MSYELRKYQTAIGATEWQVWQSFPSSRELRVLKTGLESLAIARQWVKDRVQFPIHLETKFLDDSGAACGFSRLADEVTIGEVIPLRGKETT